MNIATHGKRKVWRGGNWRKKRDREKKGGEKQRWRNSHLSVDLFKSE